MKEITDSIPQIFYDIIARIIPGSILLWTASIVFNCSGEISELPQKALFIKNFSFVESIQILLLSYIISIIINGIYMFVKEKKVNFTDKEKDKDEEKDKGEEKNTSAEASNDIIWTRDTTYILKDIKTASIPFHTFIEKEAIEYPSNMIIYDYLRIVRPEIGGRLVKLRAECHMYAVLAIGWGILFLINLINILAKPTAGGLVTEAVLLLATAGITVTLAFQEIRYDKSLKSHWVILKSGIIDK